LGITRTEWQEPDGSSLRGKEKQGETDRRRSHGLAILLLGPERDGKTGTNLDYEDDTRISSFVFGRGSGSIAAAFYPYFQSLLLSCMVSNGHF
jgi:hypothetical protein